MDQENYDQRKSNNSGKNAREGGIGFLVGLLVGGAACYVASKLF
jgi:uncharacterized UBP type Zn finger protein